MTGYEVPDDTYRLVFTDPEHEGIVVRARKMSLGERTHVWFDLALEPTDDAKTFRAKQQELHELFVDHLLEWNLTRKGQPIPQTYEGLMSLDGDFVGLLVGTWQAGRAAVPAPLDSDSSSGDHPPLVEETLAAIPSESLAS